MRILLDTHVWLWMQVDPGRLSDEVTSVLTDPDTERLLSVASAWEIVIKHAIGRLLLPEKPEPYVQARLRTSATLPLPATLPHVLEVANLPLHHRDPFDRLIVAQARVEGVSLVTADVTLAAYDVEVIQAT